MSYTSPLRTDGFGSQLEKIIYDILFCDLNNYTYVYRPIYKIGDYDDFELYKNINEFLNFDCIFNNLNKIYNQSDIKIINFYEAFDTFLKHNKQLLNSKCLVKIKDTFWKNKNKNIYDKNYFNIAIHIRRHNNFDKKIEMLRDYNNFEFYINIIKNLTTIYKDKNILFHIYSQGKISDFDIFNNFHVKLHIDITNEQNNFFDDFLGLVAADVLITNNSSFSLAAALLSDGVVYYQDNYWSNISNKSWYPISNILF